MKVHVALVGDYDCKVVAHRAIPEALRRAARTKGVELQFDWKHTSAVGEIKHCQGVWCVPASPYANEGAALEAIKWARESEVPFLGTCGGFQHAVLEFARNVVGLCGAEHAETAADSECLVISRLACSLVEVEEAVFAVPGTKLAALFGGHEIQAGYHCNFGLNPRYEKDLERAGMIVAARNAAGEPRAIELKTHPFFVGTLFQPERLALIDQDSPIVAAFVEATASKLKRT